MVFTYPFEIPNQMWHTTIIAMEYVYYHDVVKIWVRRGATTHRDIIGCEVLLCGQHSVGFDSVHKRSLRFTRSLIQYNYICRCVHAVRMNTKRSICDQIVLISIFIDRISCTFRDFLSHFAPLSNVSVCPSSRPRAPEEFFSATLVRSIACSAI